VGKILIHEAILCIPIMPKPCYLDDQINIGKLNMNIELLDQEMALEAERFGDHIRWYCGVHPQSDLGRELCDLEAGELASVFYLVSHQDVPLEYALLEYESVIAMRAPLQRIAPHTAKHAMRLDGCLAFYGNSEPFDQAKTVHMGGCEWMISDNR
jgi:hypothetical protein